MKHILKSHPVQMLLFAAAALLFFHTGIASAQDLALLGFAGVTLASTNPTLADVAARMTTDGKIDPSIVEMLSETNEVLDDMTMIEANGFTEHKTTVRSGLPSGTWRKLNYGVQPEKSRTVPVKDSMGMLETYAEVDKALADLNGNSAAWRLSEDRAFVEGINQNMATTLFYGDSSADPEKYMGLAPRYNTLSAENGMNIVDAGGTGSDNASIWLTVWGPNTLHGIYPKGSPAGLQSRDLGEQTLFDAAGGRYQGYRTHYKWDIGLTLRDWRYVVRIANIDVSDLTKNASAGADLIDLLTQAVELIPNVGMGRPVFYLPRKIRSFLRRQITNKVAASTLTMEEIAGKKVVAFDGIPCRRTDALLLTEARVV
ncbi:major capsid protein [Acidovorax sp. LjRoot74]|uniref:major capsid protein n=1 Tax=Acidovorax sp. LjRoot74 TaxID=3342337 RepID=UPI003F4FC212